MAGLKEIRTRISSVKTTMQVTSAMKLVSAAKLKKAQNALNGTVPFASKLEDLLSQLLLDEEVGKQFNSLNKKGEGNKVAIVLISSNRGLCGAFNTNIVKGAIEHAKTVYADYYRNGNIDFINIGLQGQKQMKTRKEVLSFSDNEILNDLNYAKLSELSQMLYNGFVEKKYDAIDFVSHHFISAGNLEVKASGFLPIAQNEDEPIQYPENHLFEPGKKELLEQLIPISLQMKAFRLVMESFTSEHAARMRAMHQATDNAENLLRDLTLSYNKARQTTITNEILEITGGAEALKG